MALVRKQRIDLQGYQQHFFRRLPSNILEGRARRLLLGSTTESNSCVQQEPLFVRLKGVLLRALVGGSRGLCDVANVVLEKLPITSAFHPDVRAAVCRLPVDTTAVRHDRQLAAVKEVDHVLVGHVGIRGGLECCHILCLVFDLTEWRRARVVFSDDATDSLLVVAVEPHLSGRPLFV